MKELDSKQRAFVLYAAKVLKCNSNKGSYIEGSK